MKDHGFNEWWDAWPKNKVGGYQRKGSKALCLKRWIKGCYWTQADTIRKHTEWLKTTPDWLKDGGAYIPMPITYLNQQRWDGAEIEEVADKPKIVFPVSDEHIARSTKPSEDYFKQMKERMYAK